MKNSQDGISIKIYTSILIILMVSAFGLQSCGKDYDDMSTANGRRALLDQANNYLTGGQCVAAIDVLKPLYNSIYVDYEIRMTYASAYACVAGFNLPGLITSLTTISGTDIWSPIIKSNYVSSTDYQHVYYLQKAAEIILTTATTSGSYSAADRTDEANLYMIFIQLEIIAKTIMVSTMGNADSSTGNQQTSIVGLGTNQQKCDIEVAFATITDSLTYVTAGSAITSVSSALTSSCGGACPTNKDPSVCSAATQAQGAILITALDSQWL